LFPPPAVGDEWVFEFNEKGEFYTLRPAPPPGK
jgi:hypothetical protein